MLQLNDYKALFVNTVRLVLTIATDLLSSNDEVLPSKMVIMPLTNPLHPISKPHMTAFSEASSASCRDLQSLHADNICFSNVWTGDKCASDTSDPTISHPTDRETKNIKLRRRSKRLLGKHAEELNISHQLAQFSITTSKRKVTFQNERDTL